MCGIAAIFAYHADAAGVELGELTAIRDHMTARGPDGFGNWLDPAHRIGLAHRRLSIIDLSDAGAQPMLLPQHQLVIVFNGEIYNYRELRATLEAQGHHFTSSSDTEVLLHLYVAYGVAMVDHLRGMFAFALWDGGKRGLLLARDPFGIKPLYLADDGRTLRVASQVKALLAGNGFASSRSPAGHTGFFLWGHIPEPFTLHREIRSLPPGTSLWVEAGGTRREVTHDTVTRILARVTGGDQNATTASLATSSSCSDVAVPLRDSVAHHLIADVPVGVFLSSGVDSCTLAALAAESGGTLRTVTLGFEEYRGTANDETPLAELMARQLGAQHQTIWVRRQDFRDEFSRLCSAMDQPSTDGVNTYFVSLAARRAGLKVALSGLGGDELFGGYPAFTQVPHTVNSLGWLGTSSSLGRTFRVVSAPLVRRLTSPKYAGLLEYGGSYGGAYLLRRGMFMPWELPELLDPDFARAGWNELQTLLRLDETIAGLAVPRARVAALEMCWYMRNQLLRDSDWAAMAHSLEIRVPLVDVTLLRALAPLLSSATPPSKRCLAGAPSRSLPAEILRRPKTGFQIPVRDWLLSAAANSSSSRGLRGWAREVYLHFVWN